MKNILALQNKFKWEKQALYKTEEECFSYE